MASLRELDGLCLRCHCGRDSPCHADLLIKQWHQARAATEGPERVPECPVRRTSHLAKTAEYHDGAGLLSPGRWDVGQRTFPAWEGLRRELEWAADRGLGGEEGVHRHAFVLARGGVEQLFPPELVRECRDILIAWAGDLGFTGNLGEVSARQPFLLKLMGALAKAMGDPESGLPDELAEGVTAGILHPMPRSPRMYEEQTRWRLEWDPLAEAVQYSENYSSVEEHTDWLRAHLEEEVRDGRMVRYRKEDMEKRFGQNFAVASLAVLVSPDSGKKRLVHDGTHRVGVNHRIRCRNQLRMPGSARSSTCSSATRGGARYSSPSPRTWQRRTGGSRSGGMSGACWRANAARTTTSSTATRLAPSGSVVRRSGGRAPSASR